LAPFDAVFKVLGRAINMQEMCALKALINVVAMDKGCRAAAAQLAPGVLSEAEPCLPSREKMGTADAAP
jgi:hypothetical protein